MLQCPRCHRTNPAEAIFCYFDGSELRRAGVREDGNRDVPLPHPFVFPSGRSCQTYEDLIQACQAEWEVARDLMSQDVFRHFFATAGRIDLAQAALQAKGHPDPDIALDNFLASLPAKGERRPSLDLNLRRLNLGKLHVGETRQIRLAVVNQGNGLLQGTLTVADGTSWLRLGEGRGNGQCAIKTIHQQEITVRVDTRGLAAPHQYSAKLTIITNGGIVEVPVGLDLEVQPFAQPPFQGVCSPREMAERMRTDPKPAVPLLESAEVARWFEGNGWTYPVTEPTAPGVAAVQQFFEGMGLSKPPVVQLNPTAISQSCVAGEVVHGQLVLRTGARKWVYARAESDAPWLRLPQPSVSGPQQTILAFEGQSQHLQPGRVHEANLTITANAGQVLRVPIRLEVQPATAAVIRPSRSRTTQHTPPPIIVGAAAGLVFRLMLVPPTAFWLGPPAASAAAMNSFMRHFVLLTWWVGAVAGASLLWKRGQRKTDLVYGLIAGAVAGLVGSATLACFIPALDWLPRFLGSRTSGFPSVRWPAEIVLAAASWAFWGALAGLGLSYAGPRGRSILSGLARLLAWLCRLCRLKRVAAYFEPA
ncbi:MAG TPA: sulfite exporter TauE/SafE family protein [Gemmataceae bacterium]|nr:sulfite exporter TauE/SafE family protein [Gemmataceae bacterium]